MENLLEKEIRGSVEPVIDDIGYDIVRVKLFDGDRGKILQIMIDRKDEDRISVSDCEKVSKQISAMLDVEDPIKGEYNLEVSSAGLDRPLTRLVDFKKFINYVVKFEVRERIEEQKKFRGKVLSVDGDIITFSLMGENLEKELEIDITNIVKAKLDMRLDAFM